MRASIDKIQRKKIYKFGFVLLYLRTILVFLSFISFFSNEKVSETLKLLVFLHDYLRKIACNLIIYLHLFVMSTGRTEVCQTG